MGRKSVTCCPACDTRKGGIRQCPATDYELALLRRARLETSPAKIAAFMPPWLRGELAKPLSRFKFMSDKAPVYPSLGRDAVASTNPGPDVFGKDRKGHPFLHADMTTAEYVAVYEKTVGLRSQLPAA